MKRFADGPPDVSPRTLGDEGNVGHAADEGAATASFLRGLGVDVDLAPVLDTPGVALELARQPRVQPQPVRQRDARARPS